MLQGQIEKRAVAEKQIAFWITEVENVRGVVSLADSPKDCVSVTLLYMTI
jgi:hypothetical protein